MALHARRTHQERALREDWLVVDGGWRHTGIEELPCELVRDRCFLGLGVPAKQIWSQRKGMGDERERERERESRMLLGRSGEQGQCREQGVGEAGRARSVPGVHLIRVMAPNIRKNAAHKESL
jgi:hypothetical protein